LAPLWGIEPVTNLSMVKIGGNSGMVDGTDFNGFPKKCVKFFKDLGDNNNKSWFKDHKDDYENYVMTPARDFVFEMGKRLEKTAPKIVADPRVDKSIFRIYRDTRFSKDKSPYKTHLGIFLWEGIRPKMDCPGFYFHLEPPNLMLGVGMHCFSKPMLTAYREAVVDPKLGPALVKAIGKVRKKGDYDIGVKHYKRTPRGFDPDHKNAELLLHNGLTAATMSKIPKALGTPEILDYCLKRFSDMSPIHKWLVVMTESAPK
jgi:uncharacterized protein (TIGR02453 family)